MCARAQDVFITAAVGEPFGAATIEMPLDGAMFGRTFPALRVSGGDGRVLYPVSNDLVTTGRPSDRPVPQAGGGRLLNRVGSLIRELASGDEQLNQTVARRVSFLFTGSEPLAVTVTDERGVIGNYSVVPIQDQAVHASVLKTWWTGYTNAAQALVAAAGAGLPLPSCLRGISALAALPIAAASLVHCCRRWGENCPAGPRERPPQPLWASSCKTP